MKYLSALILLPLTALALSTGYSSNDNSLHTFIPGGSPIDTCQTPAPETDLIEISSLEISPNPPQKGQNLTIIASGIVKEDIAAGARVQVVVKYGLIKLLATELDLCEQTEKVDLSCPIQAGELTLQREVELPALIPPGRYTVNAQVITEDGRPAICLVAKVQYVFSTTATNV